MKVCTLCKEEKPRAEFYSRNKKLNHVTTQCKICIKEERRKKDRGDPRVRAARLHHSAKRRAEEKGIEYSLTTDFIHNAILGGKCQVTGLSFGLGDVAQKTGNRPWAPSLDRTDPTLGYTEDNVKVVCWIYNGAKGIGTHEDVMKLVEALSNGS